MRTTQETLRVAIAGGFYKLPQQQQTRSDCSSAMCFALRFSAAAYAITNDEYLKARGEVEEFVALLCRDREITLTLANALLGLVFGDFWQGSRRTALLACEEIFMQWDDRDLLIKNLPLFYPAATQGRL